MSANPEPSRADLAASFDGVAAEYDAGRPGYPDEAVDWLVRDSRLVVELGAGTGKLTASLTRRARVVATEPLAGMLGVLARTAPAALRIVAAAEAIPLRRGVVDTVVAAQAFHWFDGPAALRSAAEVLRPGGAIALVWNTRDERVPWVKALTGLIGGSEQLRPGWDDCFADSPFGPLETATFGHSQTHHLASLLALVESRSYFAVAPAATQSAVLDGVRRLVQTHPDLANRASFELPYTVSCFRAVVR